MQYNLSKNLTLVMYNKFFVYTLNLNLTLTYLTILDNFDLIVELQLHLFRPVLGLLILNLDLNAALDLNLERSLLLVVVVLVLANDLYLETELKHL